jgi:hypothetical protein
MIPDTCDYCFSPFCWTDKPICTNCGLENVRGLQTSVTPSPSPVLSRETAKIGPAAEKAIAAPAIPLRFRAIPAISAVMQCAKMNFK